MILNRCSLQGLGLLHLRHAGNQERSIWSPGHPELHMTYSAHEATADGLVDHRANTTLSPPKKEGGLNKAQLRVIRS